MRHCGVASAGGMSERMKKYGGDLFHDRSSVIGVHILPETLDQTWEQGLWFRLNEQHGFLFDRHEAEFVEAAKLSQVASMLRAFLLEPGVHGVVRTNVEEMIAFIEASRAANRGVGFGFS